MAEYKEAHAVARLWGAPPGYIGYNDEGSFAGRLRRQPFSVVLLDEFEKAHPQVHDAFLGIFDTGRFSDARGRTVDARQAFFLLTSNLFTLDEISPAGADLVDQQAEAIRQGLSTLLRPEFVNRLDSIILFGALPAPVLARIAAREIASLNERLSRHGVLVRAGPEILAWIADQSRDPASGARAVLRMVSKSVTEPVSNALIQGRLQPGAEVELRVENHRLILKGF